ncbi:MAG TPA: ATP-binding protein [Opitutaceae bacterium]|nr:ATP-binding protein [Opitutaceae bacterium]
MTWIEANQRHLTAALAGVRAALEGGPATPVAAEEEMTPPPALTTLCARFGLSPFERAALLLCAGIELDSRFGPLCAKAQGDARRDYPTFSLALGALPGPHWSALSPAAPLRRWRLIDVLPGAGLTLSPLRIDERVLHYLTGVADLDERLLAIVERVPPAGELVESQRAVADQVAAAVRAGDPPPVIGLAGPDPAAKRAVAAAGCAALGLNLHALPAQILPADPRELENLMRIWEREAVFSASALLLECDHGEAGDAAARFIEHTGGVLLVATREPRPGRFRPAVHLAVDKPTAREQRLLWQAALGGAAAELNGELDALIGQFDFSASGIRAASARATGPHSLWDACRAQARPRLDDLAQRIDPRATWDDLVLPEQQRSTLREIAAHVRRRAQVYETWGFAQKSARGLGISVLFAGASGTGKTLAAEVLAGELRLDLYRIDLSQIVSKYIGETEKNLARLFAAAEESGAILLFDEADALFGKRSEVKDSHDRYANIEVSYLLQRMEAYRGLAILTTNMKEALDPAFLRRIRFVVQFPFPDLRERAEIWRRMFPAETPVDGLDPARLARLNVAGGNIRNIALNAAFLAADAEEPVRMKHVLRAARTEYAKIEKPLTEAEIGGWE